MAVYNSSVGFSHQDDSDITIINPSIIHEHNDEDVNNTYVPIITRLKQANNSSENRQITNSQLFNPYHSVDNKHEYIIVDHDPLENAKHLEQVLKFYICDLKQDTNTQLVCDKQLVTRLMDLIRPAYINNQPKMIELDQIMQEIGLLHDKRHIEQKEKIEQLRTEICRLNKMLFTANNEQSIYNDNQNRNYSMFSTMQGGHSINDYDQWTEIEDDAKKLHEIVETQKNQINEIITLISQAATAPTSLNPPDIPPNQSEETVSDKPTTSTPTPFSNANMISTLLNRLDIYMKQKSQPEPVATSPLPGTTLTNHSPGTSPTESMVTLIADVFTPSIDEPIDIQQPILDLPHTPIDIPITPTPPIDVPVPPPPPMESKKCPVCNHDFALTSNDVEMYDHIEKCLFPTGIAAEPKDYECPNCNKKYPGTEERDYLQHLSDCYNRDF